MQDLEGHGRGRCGESCYEDLPNRCLPISACWTMTELTTRLINTNREQRQMQTCLLEPGVVAGCSGRGHPWADDCPFVASGLTVALKIACIDMAGSTAGIIGGGVRDNEVVEALREF